MKQPRLHQGATRALAFRRVPHYAMQGTPPVLHGAHPDAMLHALHFTRGARPWEQSAQCTSPCVHFEPKKGVNCNS